MRIRLPVPSTRTVLAGLLCLVMLVAAGVPGVGLAAAPTYEVAGNTPGFIKHATDLGPVDPSSTISISVWLKLRNQAQLDRLVQAQQQQGSPNFHRWLNQDQFNATYAPTSQQVKALQHFLAAHNLTVVDVAENNVYVSAEGAVADIQKTFHVQLDNYEFRGETYRSNTADPQVDDATGAQIATITGLDDYGAQPAIMRPTDPDGSPIAPQPLSAFPKGVFSDAQCFHAPETRTFSSSTVSATYTGNRYGADITSSNVGVQSCGYSPAEVQTAYNLKPLYQAGLDGSGQTVVVVVADGSATIQQDAAAFSQVYGLPPVDLQIVTGRGLGNNPHGPPSLWALETTMDVEWAHAIAPGARIALVVASGGASLWEAVNLAVVRHLGNTISNSWASLEGLWSATAYETANHLLEMAAAEGIDVNFASGDAGDEVVTTGSPTLDYPASSPYATGVGGTSLALDSDGARAWEIGWGANLTRIAGDNASGNPPSAPPVQFGFVGGSGGGASVLFPKPAFQSGIPGRMRMAPDVAWLAESWTGAEMIQTVGGQLTVSVIGGTSLSCPMFSGLMAIAAQKAGHPLGQAAPLLYNLPPGAVFDIDGAPAGTNVTGSITTASGTTSLSADQLAGPLNGTTSYYSTLYNSQFSTNWYVLTFGTDASLKTGPGWDDVTGVGTPNGVNFVNAVGH